MALGGGYFTAQNKVLPGSYMVFISAVNSGSLLSARGVAAMGLELDWGPENQVFEMDAEILRMDGLNIFGYSQGHEKLRYVNELLLHATKLYLYRLNSGGVKAQNDFATARYGGVRGNDIKIAIQTNVEDAEAFDVQTFLGTTKVDEQTVKTAAELVKNDFVTWKANATLNVTAATAMTGGTNGTVTGDAHQSFLDQIEGYAFNTIGCASTEKEIKALYCSFGKRMREEVGSKFQVVVHNQAADYEGVINVKNKVLDAGVPETALVYWVTGAAAGCGIEESLTNKLYDGTFDVDVNYTQVQLEKAILAGEFAFHRVNSDVRVLKDIDSLVTFTDTKGEVFQSNATIRVIDEIASSIAGIFNTRYIGKTKNNPAGRMALWNDIVQHHLGLQDLGAIENFEDSDVKVTQGSSKAAVAVSDAITVTGAMEKLYLTCVIE
ncbi:phage tail sheath family protein [Anaerovorax odorimutans]|uniref:Phage tail sheath family protein n=1 Tax=Anaerovorax odorimutans TaxID=109327 RepID=A0ABT1RPP6_9FIRM|nr:phage tail sheath family protein [Anaerovorax odorimutans]MCQ4637141.1 phage tail sheath family protein [Anaerovorax odorimutans]